MKFLLLCALVLTAIASANAQQCGCRKSGKRSTENPMEDDEKIWKRSKENPMEDDEWAPAPIGEPLRFPVLGAEEGSTKVEGDMIFTEDDKKKYSGFRATISKSRQWPNGEIPYMFDRVDSKFQSSVRSALSALSAATGNCVKFREIRRREAAYARLFVGGGCYSMIGKTGRVQDLSLGRGCLGTETIQHEFMHALGFYHEQSRPDRDQHVRINWQNINSNMCGNFQTCKGCTMHTPYDIKSIMQYQGDAFACRRGQYSMVDARTGRPPKRNMQLTQGDITKIKKYYGC